MNYSSENAAEIDRHISVKNCGINNRCLFRKELVGREFSRSKFANAWFSVGETQKANGIVFL